MAHSYNIIECFIPIFDVLVRNPIFGKNRISNCSKTFVGLRFFAAQKNLTLPTWFVLALVRHYLFFRIRGKTIFVNVI